nr:hypothetical protein [Candidatus Sigynarchaeota archaeon]
DYSIKYILSRQDVYPAAKKLSWLVDKTASLIGGGDAEGLEEGEIVNEIVAKKTSFISSSTLNEEEIAIIRIADIYLSASMPLSAEQTRILDHLVDYLDGLKSTIAWITSAKKAILDEKFDDALRMLSSLESDIMNALVKARFEYKDKEYNIIHVVSAIQAYKVTFFKAYVNLLKGNILNALTHFTETGYWAMQSHQDAALLNAVYIKAMIFLSNFSDIPDFYIKAIENYEYARFLAEKIGNDQIQLKCLLAKAIASFQVERAEDARSYIQEVQRVSAKRADAAATAFAEMADFFLIFGKPEYSVFLYDEALEAAVVAGIEHKSRALLDKMKKSYIIAGVRMGDIVKGGVHLDSLLDESFNIMKKEDVDRYNEEIMKLAQFNSLMYEPFPILYKNWTNYT